MSNLDLPNLFTNSYQTIVEYADLAVVDLSKISTPEGKAEYVRQQRLFAERSVVLRQRLLNAIECV